MTLYALQERVTGHQMFGNLYKSFTPSSCFSVSPLWQIIQQHYIASGEDAWNRNIPYAVTNATLSANYHAKLAFDHARSKPYSPRSYAIVDYGAGIGQHSYYLALALEKLCKEFHYPLDHFVIYMADISPKCIEYWTNHPQLGPLFQSQLLQPIHLKGLWIDDLQSIIDIKHNGLFMVANYLLDSMPFHAFEHQQRQGIQLSTQRKYLTPSFSGPLSSIALKTAPLSQQPTPDEIETTLHERYKDIPRYTIPKEAIAFIDRLFSKTPDTIFVINDKGYLTPEELDYDENFNLTYEGSFSSSVNLDAITFCLPPHINSYTVGNTSRLKTLIITHKTPPLSTLPNCTDTAILYQLFKSQENLALSTVESLCKILNYDPFCLEIISQSLSPQTTKSCGTLADTLKRIQKNHFTKTPDYSLLHLAKIMRKTRQFDLSLQYLEYYTHNNQLNGAYYLELGILQLEMGQLANAEQAINQALNDPLTHDTASQLIKTLQAQTTSNEY